MTGFLVRPNMEESPIHYFKTRKAAAHRRRPTRIQLRFQGLVSRHATWSGKKKRIFVEETWQALGVPREVGVVQSMQ